MFAPQSIFRSTLYWPSALYSLSSTGPHRQPHYGWTGNNTPLPVSALQDVREVRILHRLARRIIGSNHLCRVRPFPLFDIGRNTFYFVQSDHVTPRVYSSVRFYPV